MSLFMFHLSGPYPVFFLGGGGGEREEKGGLWVKGEQTLCRMEFTLHSNN